MGSPSVPTPSWVPSQKNVTQADGSFMSGLSGLGNVANQGFGLAQNVVNNPYSKQAIQGAQTAGNMMTGTIAPDMYRAAGNLYNMGNAGMPYAQSILTTGFDPQHALYNQQQQQNLEQTRAIEAASGVSSTPYGAGVAAQSNTNFNLGWQNQQLQRQAAALGAYGGYMGQVGNDYTTAAGLANTGAATYNMGASLPYETYLHQQGAGLGALGQSSNLYNTQTTQAGNYLNDATNNYAQDQLPAYNAKYQANQDQWQGIGDLAGGFLGGMTGGGGNGGGGMGSLGALAALALL